MGYAGKLAEKKKARYLRKKGYSYKEIKEVVKVSKSSISRWCRDIRLSENQVERLEKRQDVGGLRGRIKGAKVQQEMRIEKTKRLIQQGKSEIRRLGERERFLVGLGLYLGDGNKGDKAVGFSNSNPKVIQFMMGWFRDFCKVDDSRFRGGVWIHDNLDVSKAEKYWSRLTEISMDQLHKTYIAKSRDKKFRLRKNVHEFGVFRILICDVDLQRKIKGWMEGVLE